MHIPWNLATIKKTCAWIVSDEPSISDSILFYHFNCMHDEIYVPYWKRNLATNSIRFVWFQLPTVWFLFGLCTQNWKVIAAEQFLLFVCFVVVVAFSCESIRSLCLHLSFDSLNIFWDLIGQALSFNWEFNYWVLSSASFHAWKNRCDFEKLPW